MRKSFLILLSFMTMTAGNLTAQYYPNDLGKAAEQGDLWFIGMPEAWEITKGSPDIIIGIVDLPADITHQDLADQIVLNYGSDTVFSHHGTATAGCAAAKTDNGIGLASTGFNCRLALYPWQNSWYKKALTMAKDGVKVISFSFSSTYYNPLYQDYIDSIYQLGTVIVAASGNRPTYSYQYPSSYNHVISVSSVGHLQDYQLPGPKPGEENIKDCKEKIIGDSTSVNCVNDRVDICVPAWGLHVPAPDNKYIKSWGTSLSAPKVAGVCGLIFSINPCFSPDEVEDILKTTAVDLSKIPENARYEGLYGAGRLDAYAAVSEAARRASEKLEGRYSSPATVHSIWDIETRGSVIIEEEAAISLQARHAITLTEGFEIRAGSQFMATTVPEMKCVPGVE